MAGEIHDDAITAALADGPLPIGELHRRLRADGYRGTESVLQQHINFNPSFVSLSTGIGHVPVLMEGVALALPVDDQTADQGFVLMHPWLDPIGWWLISAHPELVDVDGTSLGPIGTEGRFIDGVDTDIVFGPTGWLDTHRGRWMALRIRDGRVHVESLDSAPELSEELIGRRGDVLRAAFDEQAERFLSAERALGSEDPVDGREGNGHSATPSAVPGDVVLEALAADSSVLVGPPVILDDVHLAPAGLRLRRSFLVPADADEEVMAAEDAVRRARGRFGLDDDDVVKIELLVGAMLLHVDGDPEAFGQDTTEHEAAARLFSTILQQGDLSPAVALELATKVGHDAALAFAHAAGGHLDGDGAGHQGLAWLQGHCLLAMGRIDEAAAMLGQVTVDHRHPVLLLDQAEIEVHRSNVGAAHRLLTKVELVVDAAPFSMAVSLLGRRLDDLFDVVGPFSESRPAQLARRNDPCPCGSGRKYKVCHRGRELLPLSDRAGLLWLKMSGYCRRHDAEVIGDLSDEYDDAAGYHSDTDIAESPLMIDLALHEDEGVGRYLAAAERTLPDDELLLGQQWQLIDRSVFETVTGDDQRLILRNLATGDEIVIEGVDGSAAKPHQLLVGRPLPVEESHRPFSGFVPVRPHNVGGLLDLIEAGDPFDIAAYFGALTRPPRLANTDGEDMVMTDLAWLVPADVDVTGRLEPAGFKPAADDEWVLVRDTTNQADSIIATLRRRATESDAIRLEGSVNSVERADELEAIVAHRLPGAELIDRTATNVKVEDIELNQDSERIGGDPAIRQLLETRIAEFEAAWLDESIPALDGQTPRQAAADPVGREQLVRLLASFPSPPSDQPGMSADRLKAALG